MKITANKSKNLLVEYELKKLKTFDSSYFIGKSHFEEDATQNNLVFQPMYRYFKRVVAIGNGSYINYWQSKGLSDEKINSIKTPNHSITPHLSYYDTRTRVEFNGSCFKQDNVTYTYKDVVSIYIVYALGACSSHSDDPTLKKLFIWHS